MLILKFILHFQSDLIQLTVSFKLFNVISLTIHSVIASSVIVLMVLQGCRHNLEPFDYCVLGNLHAIDFVFRYLILSLKVVALTDKKLDKFCAWIKKCWIIVFWSWTGRRWNGVWWLFLLLPACLDKKVYGNFKWEVDR